MKKILVTLGIVGAIILGAGEFDDIKVPYTGDTTTPGIDIPFKSKAMGFDFDLSEFTDTKVQIRVDVEESNDGGATWIYTMGRSIQGGQSFKDSDETGSIMHIETTPRPDSNKIRATLKVDGGTVNTYIKPTFK